MQFPIADKFGGMNGVLDVLQRRRGKRPGKYAVRKWRRERRLPSLAVVELMKECEERGIPFDIRDCELLVEAAE